MLRRGQTCKFMQHQSLRWC